MCQAGARPKPSAVKTLSKAEVEALASQSAKTGAPAQLAPPQGFFQVGKVCIPELTSSPSGSGDDGDCHDPSSAAGVKKLQRKQAG